MELTVDMGLGRSLAYSKIMHNCIHLKSTLQYLWDSKHTE